jgi:hypothetical protein
MFNNKLSSIPNQNYRIDTHPSIEQLNEMIDKARGMSGVRHNYLWEIPKEFKKYTLSLHCKEKSYEETDIEWWLHEENVVGSKMLWFHKTKDIGVIYPHLLASIGERHPLHEETPEEKMIRERDEEDKPTSLGARLKRSTTSANLVAEELQEITSSQEAGQQSTMRLMSGNLRSRPIAWLLQTAAQSGLTGELKIEANNGVVIVQFGLGRPVHAVNAAMVGTEAILELFCWQEGNASFEEGKQPETASVQDSTDEILKQGSKMLESLGFLSKHGMNEASILSRPPIGLSEEQLEQRLKDGFDYGFKMQRTFYRALDGKMTLREVGRSIGLDSSRLFAIAVNFLKLGLILTPEGKSLREVAAATSNEAFATAQAVAAQAMGQSGAGTPGALKPPPGFFGGGGGFGSGEMPNPTAVSAEVPKQILKPTAETSTPPMPPASIFGGGMPDTASGAQAVLQNPAPFPTPGPIQSPSPANNPNPAQNTALTPYPTPAPVAAASLMTLTPGIQTAPPVNQEQSGRQAALNAGPVKPADRDFFDIGVPREIMTFDESSSRAVFESLCDHQTGALTSPAFQLFLEREFGRAFRFSSEFSLLIFCMRLAGAGEDPNKPASVIPMPSLALACQTISQIKRDVDMFGHVGDKAFGLILPGVSTNQSMALVDRIVAELPKLAPKLGGKWPILHFGIAGVPQDARDLPSLMKAAQEAMIAASDKSYTRIRCSEMES